MTVLAASLDPTEPEVFIALKFDPGFLLKFTFWAESDRPLPKFSINRESAASTVGVLWALLAIEHPEFSIDGEILSCSTLLLAGDVCHRVQSE